MKINLHKDLFSMKVEADRFIRSQAESMRLTFITPGHGKTMAYQQKAVEADAYMKAIAAGEEADPTSFPHIWMEAEATGRTPEEMAAIIQDLRSLWQTASAVIEKIERQHLVLLEDARTPAEIEASKRINWTPLADLV